MTNKNQTRYSKRLYWNGLVSDDWYVDVFYDDRDQLRSLSHRIDELYYRWCRRWDGETPSIDIINMLIKEAAKREGMDQDQIQIHVGDICGE